jgi:hypothetical protein
MLLWASSSYRVLGSHVAIVGRDYLSYLLYFLAWRGVPWHFVMYSLCYSPCGLCMVKHLLYLPYSFCITLHAGCAWSTTTTSATPVSRLPVELSIPWDSLFNGGIDTGNPCSQLAILILFVFFFPFYFVLPGVCPL